MVPPVNKTNRSSAYIRDAQNRELAAHRASISLEIRRNKRFIHNDLLITALPFHRK